MKRRNIVAIIQARTAASRLPNKVLIDIAGQPMLARVVERTRRAASVNEVIVATTLDTADQAIEEVCHERGYQCYRGSTHDVLDRYYQAATRYSADVIVRITADCPVIDPDVIDKTVTEFFGSANIASIPTGIDLITPVTADRSPLTNYDFAANRLPPPWGRTYPIGLDTEVCTYNGLELAWQEADQPHQREHVMPFFYEQPDRFRILHVTHSPDYGAMRWTVDTPEDLDLMKEIYERFPGRDDFSWLEILDLFDREPELAKINARVTHKNYREIDTRSIAGKRDR